VVSSWDVVRVRRSNERELLTRKRESLKNVRYGREHGNLVPLEIVDHLTLIDMNWPVLIWRTRFHPKWPEIHFYPGRHCLIHIDLVLTENDDFDPKRLKTHFFTLVTLFDLYWPDEPSFDGNMAIELRKNIFKFEFFLIFLVLFFLIKIKKK
jgi:hypothetical protein